MDEAVTGLPSARSPGMGSRLDGGGRRRVPDGLAAQACNVLTGGFHVGRVAAGPGSPIAVNIPLYAGFGSNPGRMMFGNYIPLAATAIHFGMTQGTSVCEAPGTVGDHIFGLARATFISPP